MDEADRLLDPPPAGPAPRRGFRPVPLRLLLPNIVTLLALCLGLTAIRLAMDGAIDWAVIAIAGAGVLDALDGRIARALKGTSRFGAELDSLADFVDFGVAPGLVLFVADLHAAKSFGWIATLMFAMACALRLARFNVMLDDPDQPAWRKSFFVGMPAPAGAIVGMLPIYVRFALGLGAPNLQIASLESLYVLAIAFLMASRVPHFSGNDRARAARASGDLSGRRRRGAAPRLRLSHGDAGRPDARLSRLHPVRGPALSRLGPRGTVALPPAASAATVSRIAPRGRFQARRACHFQLGFECFQGDAAPFSILRERPTEPP